MSEDYNNEENLIKIAGKKDLKRTLESFEENTPVAKSVPLISKFTLLKVAAAFIIGFGLTWFVLKSDKTSNADLYAANFEAYQAPSSVRSINEVNAEHWQEAIKAYSTEEYEDAISSLEKVDGVVPEYLVQFYLGVSHLSKQEADYQIALDYFEQVLEKDNDYNQQAYWYKGLCFLALENDVEALSVFELIVEVSFYNHEKAQKILESKKK